MIYSVTLRFNARSGGAQVFHFQPRAESVGDALEQTLQQVESKLRRYGGSICVTGVCVDEVK